MQLSLDEQNQINWQAPWLVHLPAVLQDCAQANHLITALNQTTNAALYSGGGQKLEFITQEDLPDGVAYESHIYHTGCVPTRINLHDFFNAAIWLTFPKTKAVLNARQADQIAALGIEHRRGAARDALTLFDENAGIFVTSQPEIAQSLRDFDWSKALIQSRPLWDNPFAFHTQAQVAFYSFGHALLEKLTKPYKAICAHAWIVLVTQDWFSLSLPERLHDLDHRLMHQLQETVINPCDFCPLPVLGIPHFWSDNCEESFYNDARVFRSGRTRLLKP